MWGGLAVCGRLAIGLQGIAQAARPIANLPQDVIQDEILPHIPVLQNM